jgi:hypothetical protein
MSKHLDGKYIPREDSCGELLNFLRGEDRGIINEILYKPDLTFSWRQLETMALNSSLFKADAPSFDEIIFAEKLCT